MSEKEDSSSGKTPEEIDIALGELFRVNRPEHTSL